MKKAHGQGCLSLLLQWCCSLHPAHVCHYSLKLPSGASSYPLTLFNGWLNRCFSSWTRVSGTFLLSEQILFNISYYHLLNSTDSVYGWRVGGVFVCWLSRPRSKPNPELDYKTLPSSLTALCPFLSTTGWGIKSTEGLHIADCWLPTFLVYASLQWTKNSFIIDQNRSRIT